MTVEYPTHSASLRSGEPLRAPPRVFDVRCWDQTGKHILVGSISHFDPRRSSSSGYAVTTSFHRLSGCWYTVKPARLPQAVLKLLLLLATSPVSILSLFSECLGDRKCAERLFVDVQDTCPVVISACKIPAMEAGNTGPKSPNMVGCLCGVYSGALCASGSALCLGRSRTDRLSAFRNLYL